LALHSPFLEPFKGSDLDVIILNNPYDEMLLNQMREYKSKKFVNIESAFEEIQKDLGKNIEEETKDRSRIPEEDITSYCLWLKEELKPHVGKVTISKRLRDTPCIISGQMSSSQRLAYQMMAQQAGNMTNDPQLEEASKQQTLELNPSHPLIVNLNQLRKRGNKAQCSLISRQLLDTVLTQTGIPYNFQEAVTRQYKLLGGYVDLLVDS